MVVCHGRGAGCHPARTLAKKDLRHESAGFIAAGMACMDAIRGITQSLIQSGNMTCMSLVFLSRFEFLDQSILHIARHEFVVCEVHDK